MTGVGGLVLAAPLTARAQLTEKRPVVGFVHAVIPPAEMAGPDPISPLARAFVHGLRDSGWIEERAVVIDRRSAEGQPERAAAIFAELVAKRVDVIAMGGSRCLREAAQTFRAPHRAANAIRTDHKRQNSEGPRLGHSTHIARAGR